jgi:hypothetical protein
VQVGAPGRLQHSRIEELGRNPLAVEDPFEKERSLELFARRIGGIDLLVICEHPNRLVSESIPIDRPRLARGGTNDTEGKGAS